jgi:hypothetical protein
MLLPQKGELLQLLLAPSLGLLPPSLSISHYIGQAMGNLLDHLTSLAHLRKFTIEEGDLSRRAICLLVSRSSPGRSLPPLSTPSPEPPSPPGWLGPLHP